MDSIIEVLTSLGVNWKLLTMQALNFCIVAWVLYQFAFKPVLRTMDERQKKIADGLRYADEMKEKLAEAERQQQEVLRKAQQEAQQIVAEARTSAKDYYDRQTQEAAAKVEQLLERGRQANEVEHQRMLDELRREVSRLVVQTSAKVLSKELTPAEKSKINDSASKELATAK